MISTCGQVDWNIVMINILKQLVRTNNWQEQELISSCGQVDQFSLCYVYPFSYNELEQLHMEVLLNYHLATFLYSPFKSKSGQITI